MIKLEKGQKVDLSKEDSSGSLKVIKMSLNWEEAKINGQDSDLDASVFVIDEADKGMELLYFGTPKVGDKPTLYAGALVHSGDDLTGAGGEVITINLEKLATQAPTATKLVTVVNIYQGESKGQNFGMVNKTKVVVENGETNEVLASADLDFDGDTSSTGAIFAEFIKRDDKWYMSRPADPAFAGGLDAICTKYGMPTK